MRTKLINKTDSAPGFFSRLTFLEFEWHGKEALPGNFFMIKPCVTGVFLGRPISVRACVPKKSVGFLVDARGPGTRAICGMKVGEEAELTGPLGKSFAEFTENRGRTAFVSGGAGIAPLAFFAQTLTDSPPDFFAGCKSTIDAEASGLSALIKHVRNFVFVTEDGGIPEPPANSGLKARRGLVTEHIDVSNYDSVFACGPLPMMRRIAELSAAAGVPCYLSLERRMACGTGACLGCTIKTSNGLRRVCADGPVFPANTLIW